MMSGFQPINYDRRSFAPVTNTANGEMDCTTVFHYRQTGNIVRATYQGGGIECGVLIALVDADGKLDMRYSHVNANGELMTGTCHSTPEILPDGRIRLHEQWSWTSGDFSTGSSIIEEISGSEV